jgi:hypothetical protein
MSPKLVRVILAWMLVVGAVLPAPAAQRGKEPLVERVREAIERGIDFLRRQEDGKGSWERGGERASSANPGGYTSLVLLALLNAGVKPDDPVIERGLAFLRPIEPEHTYVVSLQTMVFAEAGRKEDLGRIQRNVDWLIGARVMVDGVLRGWWYQNNPGLRGADNSNTQYALLGLHAGRQAGAKISREVWQSIQDFYIRTQQGDGSWVYTPGTSPRLTMTTAGLCGLLISGAELNAGRETLQPDGSATNCGHYAENRPAATALGWIGRQLQFDLKMAVYYNLYGVERAGRLSGLRFLGDHDWYREGCEFLVRRQKENGSWRDDTQWDNWPVVSTSFALLFLSKGRMPVLISKLVHGPGDDWNNDRHDARNLVDYASRELFRGQPMAWQIFDARRAEVRNHDDLMNLVADLLPAPIAYFNGHEAPRFTDVEKNLLKQYIEQGGFILAEACCGRPEFDRGFRELVKELFPESPLKRLPAEHPIWQAHALVPPRELYGIELGCKTVVVYSPRDLSCLWESNQFQTGAGQLAFRLGGNIIAYATGLEPPKPRLTQAVVIRGEAEGKKVPRGYLKVAQLRHEGDWQPAPRAMHNLMAHLRDQAGLDVALQTEALRPSHPDLADFKFLYMHGRSGFTYSPEDLKNLRANLETGGLLFADACCGKPGFDTAFRAFVSKLFPDKKLELIPPTDELYQKGISGAAITTVRCRTQATGGGQANPFREMTPHLEGMKLDNRWVVIYSKYDIGCALERHQSTDCLGHDTASALQLGTAVVLYALKR